MSTIRFFRAKEKNQNIEYKTGKIMNLENQEFKFYELPRTDIVRNGELRLHVDNASKVICTSAEVEFNNDFVIVIDDSTYNIAGIFVEFDDDYNNFFGIKSRQRTYITLIKDW